MSVVGRQAHQLLSYCLVLGVELELELSCHIVSDILYATSTPSTPLAAVSTCLSVSLSSDTDSDRLNIELCCHPHLQSVATPQLFSKSDLQEMG